MGRMDRPTEPVLPSSASVIASNSSYNDYELAARRAVCYGHMKQVVLTMDYHRVG